MLKKYLKKISDITSRGDAREETYYRPLEDLIMDYAASADRKNIDVTTLPRKTEAGNPDFRVWDGKQHIVGYLEAKKPNETNLGNIEDSKQLKRYIHTFPNLILTNFLEFRLYQHGELAGQVQIARPVILNKLKTAPPVEKEGEFFELLEQFFSFSVPKAYSAKTLAIELAKRTRFLKDLISEELNEEDEGNKQLFGFYEAFQQYLIKGLTKDDFADLYAQTVTYGLFVARTRSENGFSRRQAFDNIPETIGILRDVFRFISIGELPKQMEWIIDDISEVLSVADVNQILHKYFSEGKGSDPIVHFYETFLSEYDPREREQRGVYYTPEPVVSFITRSLNIILKEYFGRADGFATNSVTVLDPAAGTLTFLADAAKLAVVEFTGKYGDGGKANFVKGHLLKNFYAFELMMAPYAVGHLKMSFLMEELGYRLKKDDRFKLYLTNTLEMEELGQSKMPFMSSLAEESHLAGKVRKETPILAVLGNPPYSGHSTNIGEWISKEIRAYYKVDGKPLNEKNPKWLQDDYVKFIRFAQWKIDQAGEGVLGFITNHSYLDNPTFRGMRQSLMESFDHMYLLDLHGNSLKKEKCPDGSKDENVFDIQQGVAIGLFIKKKGLKKKIVHADLWGLREEKYDWLLRNDFKTTKWKAINPKSEFYLFVPRDEAALEHYELYPKITEIFPLNGVGMTTARDEFVIDFDRKRLLNRVRLFKNNKESDDNLHTIFNINKKKGWSIRKAWNMLQEIEDGELENYILPVAYRPFDIRWIFYHDAVVWRTVKKIMRHMKQKNVGLLTLRKGLPNYQYSWFFLSESLVSHGVYYNGNQSTEYVFPLYSYSENYKEDLFSAVEKPESNLEFKLVSALVNAYSRKISPEDVLYYIYAIVYSNTYRKKYAEFLKTDFPRVPFTADYKLFEKTGRMGKALADLHLLKSADLDNPIARFQGSGDNSVERPKYDEGQGRVYINGEQFFEGIGKEVWGYMIGGYQVLDKWLKDRKGRKLGLDDIRHYCRVATALKKTIEAQKEIDGVYPGIEENTVQFESNN